MESHKNDDKLTVFVGNVDTKASEEILFELFLQAGPLKSVKIPIDRRTGKQQRFGFVTFKHEESVKYAVNLLNGIRLFSNPLLVNLKQRKENLSEEAANSKAVGDLRMPNNRQRCEDVHANSLSNQYIDPELERYLDPNYPANCNLTSTPQVHPLLHSRPSSQPQLRHMHSYSADHSFDHERYGSPTLNHKRHVMRRNKSFHTPQPEWDCGHSKNYNSNHFNGRMRRRPMAPNIYEERRHQVQRTPNHYYEQESSRKPSNHHNDHAMRRHPSRRSSQGAGKSHPYKR